VITDPTKATANEVPGPALSLVSQNHVPNVFPTIDVPYRLAIIGDAPGTDEDTQRVPFVGPAGRILDALLGAAGVQRAGCYVGNITQYQPPNNDITEYDEYTEVMVKGTPKLRRVENSFLGHPKVVDGLAQLRTDLKEYKPHCVLLLGDAALLAARGPGFSVEDWRGSIINTSFGKAVATYHPYELIRFGGLNYSRWPFLQWDITRARHEAESPDIVLPQRHFELSLSADEICHRLDNWPSGRMASVDIEGGLQGWSCMGIADAPNHAFIVAFSRYSLEQQGRVYQSLSRFLYRDDIPKCLQNSLYDNFVLYYGFKMLIRNVREDTMLKWASIYSELPKGLDVQTSVLTREPAWKHLIAYSEKEQKKRAAAGVDPATEIQNKYRACCIDASVTLENCLAMDRMLSIQEERFYRRNVQLLPAFLSMERRGFAYDSATAAHELALCRAALLETESRVETRVGHSLRGKTSLSQTKIKKCLYEEKGYPVQYNGRGVNKKATTDVPALLKLARKFPSDALLTDLLLYSKLESVRKTLELSTDPDGRIRCAYNLVGTETMRLTCYESPTGSGANLQTITKKLRKLYRADPGYWLFQCDLAGADGWTVAAHCMRHGDPTMWLDYKAGLKPAKIIALMHTYGVAYTQCSREELVAKCKAASAPGECCDQNSWLYFGCKRVQHATNYGVQARTGVAQIMEDSYKISGVPYFMEESEFETLQRFYFLRYPGLYAWHNWAREQVADGKNLVSASGHTRQFFGRRKSWDFKLKRFAADHDTWKEFLADEPQENTTFATNEATRNLWYDPENQWTDAPAERRARPGNHIIEPLHSVHDALIGQFPIHLTEWAVAKIRGYFQNTLTIANTQVIIPFEGAYGPSWGEQGPDYGGGNI